MKGTVPDHVYRIIHGSSEKSIEDAIQNAVGRASRTLRPDGWFEVVETRGHAIGRPLAQDHPDLRRENDVKLKPLNAWQW